MPVNSTTEDEVKTAAEFTQMYNKWSRELVNIEGDLLAKADQIQSLQTSLNTEADTIKRLNENLVQTQIEQNYVDELMQVLAKEQAEIERELSKMEESTSKSTETDSDNYEECATLFESVEAELKTVKDKIKNLVEKINTSNDECSNKENPFPIYRTILDHYADALKNLDLNTTEVQEKFNTVHDVCLERCIPSDVFSSPL